MGNRIILQCLMMHLIAAVLIILSGASFAEEPGPKSTPSWMETSLVLGTTAALYFIDDDIQQWAQEKRGSTTDEIARYAKPFGDYKLVAPSLVAVLAYGHYGRKERLKKTAIMGVESLLITGIITQTLKYAGHRHRPSSGDPYDTWDGPSFEAGNDSFPSGHASTAFSVLTVIAIEYHDYPAVPSLAYGIASLTALSRVHDNKHWSSDAFFGSALGYFTARTVVGLHEKDRRIVLHPVIYNDGGLFVLSYRL